MVRVVGTDPGTSSLDLLLLVDGSVAAQARLDPATFHADPDALVRALRSWTPLDLVAAPSGYGLPMVPGEALTEADLDLMAFVRPDERGRGVGVRGFRSWVRALIGSELPLIFLPGGVHLPTIPPHRKLNTIDMGTPDKVAVAALALRVDLDTADPSADEATFAVIEVGSAFTAVLVIERGRLVDATAGTRGPIGLRSGGAWDGELAYDLSPLSKDDLFRGGVADLGEPGLDAFRESLRKHVAGLRSVTPFDRAYVSGGGLDQPRVAEAVRQALAGLARITPLPHLPGAWVKHAAQGAALIADGLAGGRNAILVESLELRRASGTIRDMLRTGRDTPASRM